MSENEHDENPSDYKVGYGKPPRETRFRKGCSGNAKGRPRKKAKTCSQLEIAWRESQRKVKASEGGRVVELSAHEALIRSVFAAAMKGRVSQQKLLLQLFASAEPTGQRLTRNYAEEMAATRDPNEAARLYMEFVRGTRQIQLP